MQNSHSGSKMKIPVLQFIDLHPSPIKHISASNHKIYVSRQKCSEVYAFIQSPSLHKNSVEQILRVEPSEQIFEFNDIIVMIKPFQLKVYDEDKAAWAIFPFTTQFTSSCLLNGFLYTFHEKETLKWSIHPETGIHFHFVQNKDIPFHINSEGNVEGYGKKVKPIMGCNFTVTQISWCGKYLFIGDDQGNLNIYQTKFLTHVKSFKRHQASILTIKTAQNFVFFTGSDSKICSLVLSKSDDGIENWILSTEVRGQSHDILSLQILSSKVEQSKKYLISGGVTTDLCFYLLLNGSLTEEWSHKISYSSEKLVQCLDEYLFVNRYSSLQIWKVLPDNPESSSRVQLLVRYDFPFLKSIQQISVTPFDPFSHKSSNQYLVMLCTQNQAVNWLFSEQNGLTKFSTISNSYTLVKQMGGQSLITLRDGNKLQKLNLKTGRIKQLTEVDVPLATDMIIYFNGDEKRILIASKYSQKLQVYIITKAKGCKLHTKLELQSSYNIIDFCHPNLDNLVVKFSDQFVVKQIDSKGQILKELVKLPFKKVRQYGWAQVLLENKRKIYWYLVGEAKIAIVSGMKTSRDKKVRVKQMPRIGNVIGNPLALSSPIANQMGQQEKEVIQRWSLAVIALNMGKMIAEQPIKPIFTKKIL